MYLSMNTGAYLRPYSESKFGASSKNSPLSCQEGAPQTEMTSTIGEMFGSYHRIANHELSFLIFSKLSQIII